MNPLFIAHLMGDYLLQPGWLVRLKEQRMLGIVIHASVHLVTMALLAWTLDWRVWAGLLVIAITHGAIDTTKVHLQKNAKTFSTGYLLDQLAHLGIMTSVLLLVRVNNTFWTTHDGIVLLSLLAFVSCGLALYNLTNIQKFPTDSMGKKLLRVVVILTAFGVFMLPAVLGS